MEKEKILVMLPTTEEERQAFYRAAPDADVYCCLPEEATGTGFNGPMSFLVPLRLTTCGAAKTCAGCKAMPPDRTGI